MIALHRQSIRSTIRAITLVAALTSLLLTMVTPFVGTADAAPLLPGSVYDPEDATLDTENIIALPDACPRLNPGTDDGPINGNTTKLNVIHDDDPPTIDADINHPGHSDLCNIWMGSEIVSGQFLLYLAWEREAPGGSSGAYWEFQQSALACTTSEATCNPFANRQAGDFIVHFDFQGNSIDDISLRFFDGTSFGPEIDPADILPAPAGAASTSDDRLFGEAVLNLTELDILDPNAEVCETFAGVIPGSATGNSDSSDYKDIVLTSAQPNITNCGTVVVDKVSTTGDDYGDVFPISLSNDGGTIRSEDLGHGESFTQFDVFSGTDYDVSETVPAGWSLDGIACELEDGTPTGTDGTDFEVIAGETTSCTVTNTPDLPTITLEKTVINDDGGSAVEDDFQGSISGVGDVDWDVATEVDPGDYTASETTLPGYTASDWGSACDASGNVSVDLGDDVTCTITNDDDPASLTLTKVVLSPNGGTAVEDDFAPTVSYDGTGDASGVTTSPDWDTYPDVPAGTYTVGETDAVGSSLLADGDYIMTSIVCGGVETDMITLDNGESGECVVTNTDVPSGLTVVKDVQNQHGGTLGATDFPLTVNGETVVTGIAESFPAGDYTIAEQQQDGYELVDVFCTRDGEDVEGISGESFDISVGINEEVVCTFVNRDIPARVTLVKTVINDDGGTLEADDFPVTLDGGSVDWETEYEVDAGEHTVAETQQDGYTTTGWGGDCASDEDPTEGAFTAVLDTDYTCTITNDDQPATVTLVKTVINDDGGTLEASDFPAFVDGEAVTWEVASAIDAGSHTASETQQPGYAAGDWGGDCAADGSLQAELGGSYTCTITNDDIAPTITLVKTVVNDDGGTLTADDFQGYVDGGEVDWEVPVDVLAGDHTASEDEVAGYAAGDWGGDCAADGSLTAVLDTDYTCTITNDDIAPTVVLRKTVVNDDGGTLTQDDFPVTLDGDEAAWDETITTTAGDHLAAELTQSGYVAGAWGGDCAADGSLTAELAGSYECTITNDDVPAGLTVVKQVVNDDGGTAVVGDFPLTVTPEDGEATVVQSGAQTIVGAGTYTISEEQQPGYALDSISCDNGTATTEGSLDVTVGLDEVVTCTIVNDDVPISISLVKVPDVTEIDFTAGGDEEIVTYTYTVTNTGELPLTDLSLVDDILGDITLPVDELAVGQTVFGTAEHVVTQEDADAGTIVNVAIVEGTSPDGRTTDDIDDAEVVVNLIEVAPQVIEKAPVLPATGFETMRLALFAALVAGLGALFLLATDEVQYARRRRD